MNIGERSIMASKYDPRSWECLFHLWEWWGRFGTSVSTQLQGEYPLVSSSGNMDLVLCLSI